MSGKKGSDPKGYNEAGKVSIEKSADGWRTDIRVGTGNNHSHTVIENGQVTYDRGVDPNGNSFTFVNSNINSDPNAHGLSSGANLPDADTK